MFERIEFCLNKKIKSPDGVERRLNSITEKSLHYTFWSGGEPTRTSITRTKKTEKWFLEGEEVKI